MRNINEDLSKISWENIEIEGPDTIALFKNIVFEKPISEVPETIFHMMHTDWGKLVQVVYDVYDFKQEAFALNK